MSKASADNCPAEVRRILAKYPNHVPVICKGGAPGSGFAAIRKKLLVQNQMVTKDLKEVVRKHAEAQPLAGIAKGAPLCILAGGVPIEAADMLVSELYRRCRATDGFLYVTYKPGNTVGEGDPTSSKSPTPSAVAAAAPPIADNFSAEARKVLTKHPDKVPVICKVSRATSSSILGTKKFLSPTALMSNEFRDAIFKRIEVVLKAGAARIDKNLISLFVEGKSLEMGRPMGELYKKYKSEDGFLYVLAEYSDGAAAGDGLCIGGDLASSVYVIGAGSNSPVLAASSLAPLATPAAVTDADLAAFATENCSGRASILEYTLKATFGQDTRRLAVMWPTDACTGTALEEIDKAVRHGFGPTLEGSSFVLKYKDNDGDLCTLVEATFKDFLSFAQDSVLKLAVCQDESPRRPAAGRGAMWEPCGEPGREPSVEAVPKEASEMCYLRSRTLPHSSSDLPDCYDQELQSNAATPWFEISTPPATPRSSAGGSQTPNNINDEYGFEWSIVEPLAAAADSSHPAFEFGDDECSG